jgi:peptidoglycan/LPS O-acetylase OafA/YrhL
VGLLIAEMTQDGVFQKLEASESVGVKFRLAYVFFMAIIAHIYRNDQDQSYFLIFLSNISFSTKRADKYPMFNELNLNYLIIGTCLITYFELSPGMRLFFESKPLEILGKISFGVYLLHPLVIPSFGSLVAAYMFNPEYGINANFASIVTKFAIAWFTFVSSFQFYLFVDKPSVMIGKWLEGIVSRRIKYSPLPK